VRYSCNDSSGGRRSGGRQGSGHGSFGLRWVRRGACADRVWLSCPRLLRKTSKRVNLAGLDVEIVEGDMRDAAAVARAIAGTRFLFHVAADYRLWARKREEILVNNREGHGFSCKRRSRRGWSVSSIQAVWQPSLARRMAGRPTRRCG